MIGGDLTGRIDSGQQLEVHPEKIEWKMCANCGSAAGESEMFGRRTLTIRILKSRIRNGVGNHLANWLRHL